MARKEPLALVISMLMSVLGLTIAMAILPQMAEQYSPISRVQSNPESGFKVLDPDTMQQLTAIDWGTLAPGETATRDIYILNLDQSKTWNLTVTTSNWNPENATEYMYFVYEDYDQNPLHVSMGILFSLTIYENCTGIVDFSFNINVNGEEV